MLISRSYHITKLVGRKREVGILVDALAHCRRELAAYKVPRQVVFLDALPKSPVGKILRKDLRAR